MEVPKEQKNDSKNENNNSAIIDKFLNDKNKLSLDNKFDENNCQVFLSEKEKYLSEMFTEEEELLSYGTIEKTKSKEEIIIPNGLPSKYTFGQY